jgi:hypothetical protein
MHNHVTFVVHCPSRTYSYYSDSFVRTYPCHSFRTYSPYLDPVVTRIYSYHYPSMGEAHTYLREVHTYYPLMGGLWYLYCFFFHPYLCMINTQNWVRIAYYISEFCRCYIICITKLSYIIILAVLIRYISQEILQYVFIRILNKYT